MLELEGKVLHLMGLTKVFFTSLVKETKQKSSEYLPELHPLSSEPFSPS